MEENNHLVAFLDILGFKNHVENFINGKKESDRQILDLVINAFNNAKNLSYFDSLEKSNVKINYKQFSDCINISTPNIFDHYSKIHALVLCGFLHLLESIYSQMLESKLLIRGGLSVGYHYENENVIFSEGLIKAYKLESESIYPRIMIDEEVVKLLKTYWKRQEEELSHWGIEKLLVVDWDGSVFINPFKKGESSINLFLSGDIEIPPSLKDKDISKYLIEKDHEITKEILSMLKKETETIKLNENMSKNVLKKYIWLQQLAQWNLDPKISKIKFEYLLK